MATRTVRLSDEEEAVLALLRKERGWTASRAIKEGLMAIKPGTRTTGFWERFRQLDLGEGDQAHGPADDVRGTLQRMLAEKRSSSDGAKPRRVRRRRA